MKLSKKLIAVPAIALAAGIGLAACGGSSLTDQANAVMQLDDSAWSYGTPVSSSDVAVVNNADTAFQNAITITNDPTQQDQDYTAIGQALDATQNDASASNWTSYYSDLGNARDAIQSARDDGTL